MTLEKLTEDKGNKFRSPVVVRVFVPFAHFDGTPLKAEEDILIDERIAQEVERVAPKEARGYRTLRKLKNERENFIWANVHEYFEIQYYQ